MNTNQSNYASSGDRPKPPPPPCPDYILDRIERKLAAKLRTGLAQAGIHAGQRRHRLLLFDLDCPMGARIQPYAADDRWWRITFGPRMPWIYPEVSVRSELTFHLDEVTEQTGVDLARLLREPDWRWPLFDHDQSYPRYAWTQLAQSTYAENRKLRQAWRDWLEQRWAERRAAR